MARTPKGPTRVETLAQEGERRRNIPTAEHQSFALAQEAANPVEPARFERARPLAPGETRERDGDRDPQIVWNGARIRLSKAQIEELTKTGEVSIGDAQLVWRGKDQQDWSDLVVEAPPLYIQEKIHPKAIIQDLMRRSSAGAQAKTDAPDLFADFNGLPDPEARLEFYQHEQHWTNRMILGDSLQVMASLAQREALKGKVQAIYFDPPYGIKFNSNWQVSTLSRDVKDGKATDITREPEQVKAFRDTWKDGIHSYLTYLRDRLTVARELLTESGSIFVQIGEENVHRVRAVMDEIFEEKNFVREIVVVKTSGLAAADRLASSTDYVLWYSKSDSPKYRRIVREKIIESEDGLMYTFAEMETGLRRSLLSSERSAAAHAAKRYTVDNLTKPGPGSKFIVDFQGGRYTPGSRWWGTTADGMLRLRKADRLQLSGKTLRYVRFWDDYPFQPFNNVWSDMGTGGFLEPKIYIVQTRQTIVERCLLMATDPGDLVLDPALFTGGSPEG